MATSVLFLAWAPFFSGAERALLLTIDALRGTEFQPTLIAGTDGELAAAVRGLGVPVQVLDITPLSRQQAWGSGRALARIIAAAWRVRPALVHANDMPSYQPGGIAARTLRVPAVSHLRFPDSAAGYRWFFRPRFTHAVFISESFRSDATALAPELFEARSTVVYDAVREPSRWDASERLARRSALGLPNDVPLVALTGQISEVKGIWDFVDAAHRLRDTNAAFVVLGDDLKGGGALRRAMAERVEALALTPRFHFLGFRPDAPELVQAFDLVTVPSHVEPFGLASLEAMAAGLPVVASRVGGIPEVVVDGETGLLVPPRSPDALAAGVRALLDDPERMRSMGARGQWRASSVFSPAAHARALTALYRRLLGRDHQGIG